jgi:hypothetical protein
LEFRSLLKKLPEAKPKDDKIKGEQIHLFWIMNTE